MPGSFSPEDYIDFYENPFESLDGLEPGGEKREPRVSWALKDLPDLDITDLDWHKYGPPNALKKAPNITSPILLDIIQSSLKNIKARNIEEDRQRKESEEKQVVEENGKGKDKEPYLPVIIPGENHVEETTSKVEASSPAPKVRKEILMTTFGPSVITKADAKANKKRLFALRRFFQRSYEKGESSATGAALGALREEATEASQVREGFSRLTKPNPVEEVECVSCLDDFHPKDVIKVPCHSYCRDCFVRLVSAACQNEQQWPPKCCLNEIPFKTVLRFISSDLKKTFEERSKEWELPVSERIYCSDPNCSLWIKPKRIDLGRRQGEDCPQDNDMNLTNQLAEDEGWKRCFNCNALVEHREACQHMTCRCGTQFCYVCSRRWRTCACTMDDLRVHKEGAAARRAERRAQELVEAEELRQILLQIEEFEREEALKAELLRLEQERLEEERRQRELEERVRQESIRRRDIETKYQELRTLLDEVHGLQQVLLDVDHEKVSEILAIEVKAAKEELEQKHETERSELKAATLARITEEEHALNKDFNVRASKENDLEKAYYERLKAYWKDKENGDQEIETAMHTLKKGMDQKHHAWQKWKAQRLKALEAKLEDSRTYREELMYSAKHRMNDSCKKKEMDMVRRMVAEKKWLEAVILERERLLNELEVQEVEGDADSIFAAESEDSGSAHYVVGTVY
ncbi:putative E3 ubiquitin-protein ligase ARI9 [Fusarium austroafricanum]|uniref:Putative E3 ubiquitin-protein ligase ARI9 n=1 Tax=Fusarium austroafricanum TaxID=2364996 RepID=A0A8H4KRE0_9HYPO|nr:putative E3 ubiquitin-protein ligase ARI9 [Fusarium austroafricanum]